MYRSNSGYMFFRGMYANIRHVVKSCDLCQRTKHSTVSVEGPMQNVLSMAPLFRVSVDIFDPLPHRMESCVLYFRSIRLFFSIRSSFCH